MGRAAPPWGPNDDTRLQDLWQSFTVRQISKAMGRHTDVIRDHANGLGLPTKLRTSAKSISLRGTPLAAQPTNVEYTRRLRAAVSDDWRFSCTGVGRSCLFSGVLRRGDQPAVIVLDQVGRGRVLLLPPRSDLVDAGDSRLDWRTASGRRQLAVAILGYLRPDTPLVSFIDPFLSHFSATIDGRKWSLPGSEVEAWLSFVLTKGNTNERSQNV